jgi:hypothetical protein
MLNAHLHWKRLTVLPIHAPKQGVRLEAQPLLHMQSYNMFIPGWQCDSYSVVYVARVIALLKQHSHDC